MEIHVPNAIHHALNATDLTIVIVIKIVALKAIIGLDIYAAIALAHVKHVLAITHAQVVMMDIINLVQIHAHSAIHHARHAVVAPQTVIHAKMAISSIQTRNA